MKYVIIISQRGLNYFSKVQVYIISSWINFRTNSVFMSITENIIIDNIKS